MKNEITITAEAFDEAVNEEMLSVMNDPKFEDKGRGAFLFAMGGVAFAHCVKKRLFVEPGEETEEKKEEN